MILNIPQYSIALGTDVRSLPSTKYRPLRARGKILPGLNRSIGWFLAAYAQAIRDSGEHDDRAPAAPPPRRRDLSHRHQLALGGLYRRENSRASRNQSESFSRRPARGGILVHG
jgi:hypothetical protein